MKNQKSLKTNSSNHVLLRPLTTELLAERSQQDMINKLKIVEEELDESLFWLELIKNRFPSIELRKESIEADTLLRIIVSSIKTLRLKST